MDAPAVIDVVCTACHTRERIDSAERGEAEWTGTFDRIIGHDVELTDAERDVVIEYLDGGPRRVLRN